jgi:hypothetical protein
MVERWDWQLVVLWVLNSAVLLAVDLVDELVAKSVALLEDWLGL